MCSCGTTVMYQKYIKGTPNRKHWFIKCNCGKFVECRKKEKAIEMYNNFDNYNKMKGYAGLYESLCTNKGSV